MNSIISNSLDLKYQKFTPSCGKVMIIKLWQRLSFYERYQ